MSRLRSNHLSWSDRLGIIKHFGLSDARACASFGVNLKDLRIAYNTMQEGLIHPNFNQNFDLYKEELGKINLNNPSIVTQKEHFITATKPQRPGKKRGPKSSKIEIAFKNIPTEPVSVTAFAKKHDVSVGILRQGKRFDKHNRGRTHVKKNKETKELMIWREKL